MAWETPLLTDLIQFNFSAFEPGVCSVPLHLHPFHQLDTILAGQVTVSIERRRPVRLQAGDGLLIPPLLRHGYRSPQGFQQGSFKFRVAPRYWGLFGTGIRRLRPSPSLLGCIRASGERHAPGAPLARQQALAVATLCLVEAVGESRLRPRPAGELDALRGRLWPLLEQIESNPHAGGSVASLARGCNLSPDYFARRFKQILRQSPQQYLLQARMRAAASELLAAPPRPIKEIAEASGYATVHAFTRAFTRAFGISPAAYRRTPAEL